MKSHGLRLLVMRFHTALIDGVVGIPAQEQTGEDVCCLKVYFAEQFILNAAIDMPISMRVQMGQMRWCNGYMLDC